MKTIYRWLCLAIGAVIGSGCDSDDCTNTPDSRTAMVSIDGQVVDELGAPLPNIHVAFEDDVADTTDASGNWSIATRGSVPASCVEDVQAPCMLTAHEVGHPDGDIYLPSRDALQLEQTLDGNGNWDLGLWEQHDVRVVMSGNAVLYGPPCAARAWLKASRSGPV
ncbi:MAG: carboxypeptidase regulatory-like domain-containing protein [bacterium]|nr:carboxypeptidase regulatory-like domain-containing protein [bacterium]